MNNFEMPKEGYIEAKKYLKSIDKLKDFENNNTSVDGYSLIYYANTLRIKDEQN